MPENQRGEQFLFLTREAGHVAVQDEIGAVFVVARPTDRQPDLVQARCPAQQPSRLARFQTPVHRGAIEQDQRGSFHATGLLHVDCIALHRAPDRFVAHVGVVDAAEQVEQEPLAQRALGSFHRLDLKNLEGRAQDREAAGEHRCAIWGQAGEFEFFDAAAIDQGAPHLFEARLVDAALAPMIGTQHALDPQDRARGSDAHVPAEMFVGASDR